MFATILIPLATALVIKELVDLNNGTVKGQTVVKSSPVLDVVKALGLLIGILLFVGLVLRSLNGVRGQWQNQARRGRQPAQVTRTENLAQPSEMGAPPTGDQAVDLQDLRRASDVRTDSLNSEATIPPPYDATIPPLPKYSETPATQNTSDGPVAGPSTFTRPRPGLSAGSGGEARPDAQPRNNFAIPQHHIAIPPQAHGT